MERVAHTRLVPAPITLAALPGEAGRRRRRDWECADTGLGIELYLPAILADPIAAALGVSRTVVLASSPVSLLLSAVLGSPVGRAIDNRGGRGLLPLSNLVLAAGLVLLGLAKYRTTDESGLAYCLTGRYYRERARQAGPCQ